MCIGGVLSSIYLVFEIIWRFVIIFLFIGCKIQSFFLMYPVTLRRIRSHVSFDIDSNYNAEDYANEMATSGYSSLERSPMRLNHARSQIQMLMLNTLNVRSKINFTNSFMRTNSNNVRLTDRINSFSQSEASEMMDNSNSNRLRNYCHKHRKSIIIRISAVVWYILQIVFVKCMPIQHDEKIITAMVAIPIVAYLGLFSDQCRIKLFQILTGVKRTNGPVLLKGIITVWVLTGILFFTNMFVFSANKDSPTTLHTHTNDEMHSNIDHFLSRAQTVADKVDTIDFSNHVISSSESYPICFAPIVSENPQILNIMDVTFLSSVIYQSDNETMEDSFKVYFSDWNQSVQNIRVLDVKTGPPKMMHVQIDFKQKDKKSNNKVFTQDLIVIRGTYGASDVYQDFRMYSEVLALDAFSYLIPISTLWPRIMLQTFINTVYQIKNVILWKPANNYVDISYDYFRQTADQFNWTSKYNHTNVHDPSVIVIGHSLGGALAHIVASKVYAEQSINVRSFGIGNPGLLWSAKKFGITAHAIDSISTTVARNHDPCPQIDKQGGLVQSIECHQSLSEHCHSSDKTMCELFRSCYTRDAANSIFYPKKKMLDCVCNQHNSIPQCLEQLV